MPQFSIIVPVYKVEQYVGRCIDSILCQSFADFELILIDDGSPDQSGAICDEYARKDDRIRVVHQSNQGVSAARNAGIDIAIGKYVAFVDSDDEIATDYLLLMECENSNFDLVVGGVKNIDMNGEEHHKLYYEETKVYKIERLDVLAMSANRALNFVYAKRFKTCLIKNHNIKFDTSMNIAEDTYFVANYLCFCNNIKYIESDSYKYYNYDHETLSSYNDTYVERLAEANKKIANLLSKHFGHIEDTLIWKKRYFDVFYYGIFSTLRSNKGIRKKIKMLKQIFDNEQYLGLSKELDVYMPDDSTLIKWIISTKCPIFIWACWEFLSYKRKVM